MISSINGLSSFFDSYAPSMAGPEIRERRLERMERLLDRLGHPEREYRTYHVAGSKGKGSVSAFLAALLEGDGRRCGLYTSPHLYSILERFKLPFSFFPEELYLSTANMLEERLKGFSLPEGLGPSVPTTFELYTAYGYLLFREYGCTDAVIETGLGGRLDATNTISPLAVLLTPIELEHTQVLGNDIRSIALEKAKIMRPGVPAFVSLQSFSDASLVFSEEARSIGAPLTFLSDELESLSFDNGRLEARISGMDFSLRLSTPSKALGENALLALLCAAKLSFLTEEGLRLLEKVRLPGRFERLSVDGIPVVVDAAHTVQSARRTKEAFLSLSPEAPALLFSAIEGKDIEGMLKELVPLFRAVVITSAGSFKRNDPEKVYWKARALFPDASIYLEKDPDKALDLALSLSGSLLIAGSFYMPPEMGKIRRAHESELERA